MPDYQTIRGISTFEYEEKRSRFIASAAFADTEEAALAYLNRIKAANRTARHNVYAYVLREGGRTRYSDDGEPAKTAGTPVLEAIGHAGLSDVIVVVTRYFGGVLLGTGGLVRAYTAAASGALQQAEIVSMRLVTDCAVTVPYPKFEQAQRMIADVAGVVLFLGRLEGAGEVDGQCVVQPGLCLFGGLRGGAGRFVRPGQRLLTAAGERLHQRVGGKKALCGLCALFGGVHRLLLLRLCLLYTSPSPRDCS